MHSVDVARAIAGILDVALTKIIDQTGTIAALRDSAREYADKNEPFPWKGYDEEEWLVREALGIKATDITGEIKPCKIDYSAYTAVEYAAGEYKTE